MNVIDFEDANWVEKAWVREGTLDFHQYIIPEQNDNNGVGSFEMYHQDNLSVSTAPARQLLLDGGETEVTTEKKPSRPSAESHESQKYHQGVTFSSSSSLAKRGFTLS